MNELVAIIQNIMKEKQQKSEELSMDTFICKYCRREFRKEKTLSVHLCEPKRRWEQKNERHVVLGMKAFLRFYEVAQGTAKLKTYKHFVESPYYNAFVKFGKYILDIRAVNPDKFIDYVIINNIKLDTWTHEAVYTIYLEDYINKEEPDIALERSVKTMVKWSEEKDEDIGQFFKSVTNIRLVNYIKNGRISPWILYNCKQGQEALEQMNDDQLGMLYNIIDPRLWHRKNKNYPGDAEYIKHVLHEAGID